MKIALVCPYDLGRRGGVQDQVIKLADWLRRAGHDAWLVGPGERSDVQARLVGPITVVKANGAGTPISLSPRSWRRTIEAAEEADIVHVHEPLMPVVGQAATAVDRPKVGTFHADPSAMVRRLYRVGGPILRRVTGRLDHATAVSPVAAAPLGGLANVDLVPNGIEVDSFRPGTDREARVAFLGRPDPRKGLDVLLRAWPLVRSEVPGAALVVGGTEGKDVDGITYLGSIDEEQKRDMLGSAAVFCAPNTHGESFGIILAEAMASGCAVVASGLPGFVHVAGDAARFVPPGDHRALANAVVAILESDETRGRLVASALERVRRFDASKVTEQYLAAYERALTARDSTRRG